MRRGYLRGDREWLGSMGGASGYLSVLVLALYINSEQVVALYRRPLAALAGLPAAALLDQPHVAAGAPRARSTTIPIVATVRDPASYVIGVLVALVMYLAL